MTDTSKNLQNLFICMLVLLALTYLAYLLAPIVRPVEETLLDTSLRGMGIRFLFMGLGMLAVLGLCYATREDEAWALNAQKIVYMAIGAVLYGVFVWMFNGATFAMPALSQVSLRPAVVLPVFFGYVFGPVVGLMAGAGGNLIGDLFAGSVSPHWTMANGLIGLFAGLPLLFEDRRQSWDLGAMLTGLGGILASAFFLANSGTQFRPTPASEPADVSVLLGFSVLLGCALAIAVRFAFPNRLRWAEAAVWGAAGNVVGLLLASIADIWASSFTFQDAVVGQFIPAAGPNVIAVAILAPLLLAAYTAIQAAQSET